MIMNFITPVESQCNERFRTSIYLLVSRSISTGCIKNALNYKICKAQAILKVLLSAVVL